MELRRCRSKYLVSDDGRVFSEYRAGNASHRELKQEKIWSGYRRVRLATEQPPYGEKVLVHVLVLEAFVGPRPSPSHEARHMDGNKENNTVANLAWGTATDNRLDRSKLTGGHKLTEDDAKEIKRLLSERDMFQWQIAELFDVSRATINDIACGRTWNWVGNK